MRKVRMLRIKKEINTPTDAMYPTHSVVAMPKNSSIPFLPDLIDGKCSLKNQLQASIF